MSSRCNTGLIPHCTMVKAGVFRRQPVFTAGSTNTSQKNISFSSIKNDRSAVIGRPTCLHITGGTNTPWRSLIRNERVLLSHLLERLGRCYGEPTYLHICANNNSEHGHSRGGDNKNLGREDSSAPCDVLKYKREARSLNKG